jgi:hypothetical protein
MRVGDKRSKILGKLLHQSVSLSVSCHLEYPYRVQLAEENLRKEP